MEEQTKYQYIVVEDNYLDGQMAIELDIYGKKALKLVMDGKSLFITGKAGTGKTTVLREIASECKRIKKKFVVLAPTGVAAKNAQGVTIHSFFQLPLSPYIPGMKTRGLYGLRTEEMQQLVNEIEMIIIDEVSMVRCDLLDEIDDVLRHYRKNDLPFGGVQMVMFGDLYQLMPVAPEEDWEKLKEKYDSAYFFSSKVLEKIHCPMFELKKIHRQDERNFVTLLNNVRRGHVSQNELKELEGRYKKNFIPNDDEGYIRLTTHNWRSKRYNEQRLVELPGTIHEYKAYIEDFFPKEEWPTNYVLELKRGARVMFIKNDNQDQQYVNGTLGTVVSLGDMGIIVRTDDGLTVGVERQTWDFYRYHINKQTKEIEAELCGSFKQYPLKLAWAVTIHKSQGLTFDKVIIDAGKAFTYGQVYVALSRCRTFHGIVLVSPITSKVIKSDPIVTEYLKTVDKIIIDDEPEEEPVTHLSHQHGAKRTLWMIKDGLSPQKIAEETNQRVEIILSHIAKLIEKGEVSVSNYVTDRLYHTISAAIKRVGIDAKLTEIKNLCLDTTKFADIRMVIADIKRKKSVQEYRNIKEEIEEAPVTEEREEIIKVKLVEEKIEVKEPKVVGKSEKTTTPQKPIIPAVPLHGLSKVPKNYRKTYQLLSQGYTPGEIAKRRFLTVSTIVTHISYFINRGDLKALDFMSQDTYNTILNAVKIVGMESHSAIKHQCGSAVTYDEIKMAVTDIARRYYSNNEDNRIELDWVFVKGIKFVKSSKYFSDSNCRVVLGEKGYYLELSDEYIKLGDYPRKYRPDQGNVWIKRPVIDKGYRLVHETLRGSHLIGYLKENEEMIVFTNPEGKEFTITFNEE